MNLGLFGNTKNDKITPELWLFWIFSSRSWPTLRPECPEITLHKNSYFLTCPQDDKVTKADSLNITDNDSLACTIAVDAGADLAILMSDVEGIYDKPPSEEGSQLLSYFNPKQVEICMNYDDICVI